MMDDVGDADDTDDDVFVTPQGKAKQKLEVISLSFNELTMILENTFGDLPVRTTWSIAN